MVAIVRRRYAERADYVYATTIRYVADTLLIRWRYVDSAPCCCYAVAADTLRYYADAATPAR